MATTVIDPTGRLHRRRLHTERAGSSGPVVLLEAGLGCPSTLWDPIWQSLQAFCMPIRYDRANIGQSDPAPSPRSPDDLIADMNAVLQQAGGPGPYILIGHSFGGLLVRLYADRFPDRVAGLVLIDASHHAQNDRMLRLLPPAQPGENEPITALRVAYSDQELASPDGLNVSTIQRATGMVRPLGAVPLVVLSRSVPITLAEVSRRRPGLPPDLAASMEELWQTLQGELADLSSQSTHLLAKQGGHFLHHDDPSFVVSAIQEFVNRVIA